MDIKDVARKGGKATGFVLTILLVFIYYFLSLGGVSLGRLNKIPPSAGVWLGNFVFLAAGLLLVWRANLRPLELDFHGAWRRVRHLFRFGPSPGETTMGSFAADASTAAAFRKSSMTTYCATSWFI